MRLRKNKTAKTSRRQRPTQPVGSAQIFTYRAVRSSAPDMSSGRRSGSRVDLTIESGNEKSWLRYGVQRGGFIIGGIALIVCAVELLWLTSDVKIVTIQSGTPTYFLHSSSVYQQTASRIFASSLANSNKVTVNAASISKQIEADFPELSSVSVTLPLIGHRPIVYLQAGKPTLILVEGGQPWIVDQDGRIEARANDLSGINKLHLPIVRDLSNVNTKGHGTVLPSSDVTFISGILTELAHGNISIGSITLPAVSRELDVAIKNQPFYVKFNLANTDARQQVGTFLATWHYLQQHHQTPAQYIDVRVGSRAYYK